MVDEVTKARIRADNQMHEEGYHGPKRAACDGHGLAMDCPICNNDGRYGRYREGRLYLDSHETPHSEGFRIGLLEKRVAALEKEESDA